MHDANDQPAAFLFLYSVMYILTLPIFGDTRGEKKKESSLMRSVRPSVQLNSLGLPPLPPLGHVTTEGRELTSDLTSQLSVPYESLVTTLLMFRLVHI